MCNYSEPRTSIRKVVEWCVKEDRNCISQNCSHFIWSINISQPVFYGRYLACGESRVLDRNAHPSISYSKYSAQTDSHLPFLIPAKIREWKNLFVRCIVLVNCVLEFAFHRPTRRKRKARRILCNLNATSLRNDSPSLSLFLLRVCSRRKERRNTPRYK